MKNCIKISMKASNGITLIALVITIIVLLILAGISISMLSGDNGILQQTTTARTRTIHANVLEQMQLEASAYTVDKTTGNYSNSLIDYLKSKSIISDISGEEDKWLINVTTLLGSNQSMGNGTYPNDVYVLEKQDTSTGSISNKKIATLTPIKISVTNTNENTYIIKYYEKATIENLTLGYLYVDGKTNSISSTDDLDKLKTFYIGNNYPDVGGYQENISGNKAIFLFKSEKNEYIQYNNKVYKITYDGEKVQAPFGEVWRPTNATDVLLVDGVNLDNFDEIEIDGTTVLCTPSTPENPVHSEYSYVTPENSEYYYYTDGNIDRSKPFTGYIVDGGDYFYNTSGEMVEVGEEDTGGVF